MSKKIYFDLDGTLYDLYNIPNWLEQIQREDSGLFNHADKFIGNYDQFVKMCLTMIENGYTFGVITWLPAQASPEYEEICRQEKLNWIHEYLPFIKEINIISYGTPKQSCIQKRAQTMYLIDDNLEVCKMWDTQKQRISKQIDLYIGRTAEVILKEIYSQVTKTE